MPEVELERRVKYAGDVHTELLKAGWDCCTAAEFLNNIPDADVAPVRHGRWATTAPHPYCSLCFVECRDKTNYCPNCGSIMDKEEP